MTPLAFLENDMQLHTSIKPRRDGTVRVLGEDGQAYVFRAGQDGELSCDVTDKATAAKLLRGDLFWPANDADMDAALALTGEGGADGGSGSGEDSLPGGDPDGDDDPDSDDDDQPDANALPQEANTPPAPASRRGARKAR